MEKIHDYMFEIMETNQALKNIETLGNNASFIELEFSKQRRKYEEISKIILNCELKPFNQENEILVGSTTKRVLKEILEELFPNKDIDTFLNKIKIDKTIPSSEYDCVTEIQNDKELVSILIWEYRYLSIIPNLGHEFVHATYELMPIEELIKIISNIHYKELASILTEMIVASKAEEILNLPFLEAINSLRVNHIKQLHLIDSTLQTNEHKINNDSLVKKVIEVQKHETFTYTISDIYATNFFYYYNQDEKNFLKLFRSMLNGEITMLDLLNFYQISLSNFETVNQYKKKIESVSK